MGTAGTKSINILVTFIKALVIIISVSFVASAPAYSWGETDDNGSYYCDSEGFCGAGWVWDTDAKECVKLSIS